MHWYYTSSSSSSALAHLVHRQWFIVHPWTRVDRWGTGGGDASRRYKLYTPVSITQADNECRLEGDKTHEIFHFLSKKVGGGHFLCGPHQAEKWGDASPRPPPIYARDNITNEFPFNISGDLPLGIDDNLAGLYDNCSSLNFEPFTFTNNNGYFITDNADPDDNLYKHMSTNSLYYTEEQFKHKFAGSKEESTNFSIIHLKGGRD